MDRTRVSSRHSKVIGRTAIIRIAAGFAVLLLLLLAALFLIPPYFENWKLQKYVTALVEASSTEQQNPDVIRALVVDRAASLGLPVHTDDVHVTKQDKLTRIEVLYVVPVNVLLYTVDLHFRPGAGAP